MKVWIVFRQLIDWNTRDTEESWWLVKKEEDAKKGFQAELEAYYERFGKYKEESYSEYLIEDGLVKLEVPGEHRFLLLYQEEPVQ